MSGPYVIGKARYAKGQMTVRGTAPGPYKDRAKRLIGDGLNCRWSGRERAYIASPSKVAKFEALYASGFDASAFSGSIYHPDDFRRNMTVGEAMKEIAAKVENRPAQRVVVQALSGPEIGSNVIPFGGKTHPRSMESAEA